MKVTYFGTTTLLFDDGKDQILFDCHFTRPSLPDYIRNKPTLSDEKMADRIFHLHKIKRLSAIFISHSHHDHVMERLGTVLGRPEPSPIVSLCKCKSIIYVLQ